MILYQGLQNQVAWSINGPQGIFVNLAQQFLVQESVTKLKNKTKRILHQAIWSEREYRHKSLITHQYRLGLALDCPIF